MPHQRIAEGMTVYSSDGYKLGRIVRVGTTSFEMEKGFFFPKDYLVRFSDIAEVRDQDVRLNSTKESLEVQWQRADILGEDVEPMSEDDIRHAAPSLRPGEFEPGDPRRP